MSLSPSRKPAGPYSTDGYADQVAAFLGVTGVERAYVAGVSLGAAVGIHLAARHPGRVRSLSLHGCWDTSDGRERGTGQDLRSDPAHLRSARPGLLHARFAEPLKSGSAGSELVVFEHLSHAGLHKDPETFNRATLDFLLRESS